MKLTVKTVALSGVALGMFVTVANAADAVVTASDWTGFNVGIGGGGSFGFSNTDAAGFGVFSVSGDESWFGGIDGGYIFGDVSSGNYGYTDGELDDFDTNGISGGNAELWAVAGMGNAGSLLSSLLDELNIDGSGGDEGGDNDTGAAGFVGTVRGGFDYQLDRVVIGVDAAFNFGKTEIDNTSVGAAGGYLEIFDGSGSGAISEASGSATLSTSLELGNSWSVGGRAGFLATDSTLLFGSAGYVSTHAKLSVNFTGHSSADVTEADTLNSGSGSASAGFDMSSSDSDWLNGYYVGVGIEQLLTNNISMKLEYRFSDLGSIETEDTPPLDDVGDSGSASWNSGVAAKASPTVHSIMATINWRF